jgi:hypothetical protein
LFVAHRALLPGGAGVEGYTGAGLDEAEQEGQGRVHLDEAEQEGQGRVHLDVVEPEPVERPQFVVVLGHQAGPSGGRVVETAAIHGCRSNRTRLGAADQ